MSKREKIIVALMAVAVLYGAWEVLRPKSGKPLPAKGQSAVSDESFVTQMNATLNQLSASKAYEYVMKQATTPWPADPFGQEPFKAEVEAQATPDAQAPRQIKAAYTGFIKVGEKTMAIINGMEYESGETIDPGGLVVEQIAPHQVVLRPAGQGAKVTIPLEESE